MISDVTIVKGRNIVPWVERLKMDTYYAEHVSAKLDLEILFIDNYITKHNLVLLVQGPQSGLLP